MRIGIGIKLFTSVLLASIVMAVAMGFATRISFQRGNRLAGRDLP